MPEEHVVNVIMGRPLTTKGHISYTKAYSIIKAENMNSYSKFSELDFNIIVRLKIYQFEMTILIIDIDKFSNG